jgi:F0F1-type ATP synthase alpha subunit
VLEFEEDFLTHVDTKHPDIIDELREKHEIGPELEQKIKNALERFKKEYFNS